MSWFDRLTVDCIQGNLIKSGSEVIACNTNIKLALNYSLGQQLLHVWGNELTTKLDQVITELPNNQFELGQARWIDVTEINSVKAIIFFSWWALDNTFDEKLIYKCIASTLRVAFSHNCASLAFPLFGSGSGSMNFQLFQSTVVRALREFNQLKNSDSFPVEEIFFVSPNCERIDSLSRALHAL